ncbi:cytochrome P450 [Auriscalpium vulgare]|uniref:Cytochrome P450 n=1 Tax=Auriscalpium vulgare TaxID=40419 RepID=A0ACB8S8D7_9AGAM|nr:cytochrome P450 [Auriscalpium vulgare]
MSYLWIVLDLLVAVVAFATLHIIRDSHRKNNRRYPPGPKALPFIGNLLDVSSDEPYWLRYDRLGKPYGDIYSLKVYGQLTIVLQSYKAVTDLLEKRSSIYSDRLVPTFVDMAGYNWRLPASQPDDHWRIGRRTLDRTLRPSALVQHRPMLETKAQDFLRQLLSDPNNFEHHIRQLQGSIIMELAYGYEVQGGYNDEHLKNARSVAYFASIVWVPGVQLVNSIPFLRHIPAWVPFLSYQGLAKAARQVGEASMYGPWNFAKDEMEKGTARPSMALDELRERLPFESEQEERGVAAALGSIFTAGSDTTASLLYSFFLMLVLYPSVQERAQTELDAVTGGTRLPGFEDRDKLHYVNALCKELVRWRLVTPIGVPHATAEDDVYQGFLIPKGSLVIANGWSILHDPAVYPELEKFNPERFLTDDGLFKDDLRLSIAFGAGKRICPGRFVVDSTVFIIVARVLSAFTVDKSEDGDKNSGLDAKVNMGAGVITRPEPFTCTINPRSKVVEELVSAITAPNL